MPLLKGRTRIPAASRPPRTTFPVSLSACFVRLYPASAARILGLAAVLVLTACAGDGNRPATVDTAAPASEAGNFLAARQAERQRDYAAASRFMLAALEESPDNYDMLVRAQTFLVANGQVDEAVGIARRTLRVSPGHSQSALIVALADVKRGDFIGAERQLEGQPLTAINRIVLPLVQGWVHAGQNRPAAALNALRPMLEVNGFRPLYEYHSALINDYAGRPELAEEHYKKSLEIEGGAPARLVEAAGSYYERVGRRDEARALYAKFQSDTRDSAAIAAALARVSTGGAPPPRLVPTATAGLAEALFNVAGALRQENNQPTALVYGRLALALQPDMAVGVLLVADILDGYGRREEANELYARIPRSSPLDWSARVRMAENLHLMEKTDEAVKTLEAMAAERPDRIEPLISLGAVLRSKDRYADAVKVYDRALARVRTHEPRHWSVYYARGIANERSRQWTRAEADFLRALELQPEQPDVMNYLAYSWVDQGITRRYEEARLMLERAVTLRPNSGHIVDSLGWVLYRTGYYAEAVEVLERAVELLPGDPVLLDHLGDAYWQVGRSNEARFQWHRALSNKPEPDAKTEIERKIDRGLPMRTVRQGS
jgi:tetratricopeptide (TPR) repeat protein